MCCVVSNNNSRGRKSFSLLWKESLSQKQSKQTTTKNLPAEYQLPVFEPNPNELCSVWIGLEEETQTSKGWGLAQKQSTPAGKGSLPTKPLKEEKLKAQGEALSPCWAKGAVRTVVFPFSRGAGRGWGELGERRKRGIECVKAQTEGAGPWSWAAGRGRVGFGRS